MKNFRNTSLRTWKRLAIILLACCLTDIFAVFVYYYKVQAFISSQAFNSTVDAGVVFFGPYNRLTNEFGNDTKRRLEHTVYLYESEKINHIICVGGARVDKKFSGSKKMQNYLMKNGIDAEKILYDSLSYDTKTNWHEALKIIDRNHFNSIVIISSPLHVYRIAKIADRDNTFYSPYTYDNRTIYDHFSIYKTIHHEWTAFLLLTIFPERIYLKILHWYRN